MQIRIDGTAAMAAGETRVFEFVSEGRAYPCFLIRHAQGFSAYRNQCQHWPVPMDLGDGDFYYAAIDRIVCKTHGATYEPATGFCDSGPCFRGNLTAYAVETREDCVLVTVPD